jgi:DNA invertase Pin-like site-specific DNA recombinase
MPKPELETRVPVKDRIADARALGYHVHELEGGNGRIAAVYGRVSSPKQARESIYSLARQRELAGLAASMDYSAVISILADMDGVSATLGAAERHGFGRLCRAISLGIVDDVFAMVLDRLLREWIISHEFAVICLKNNTRIIFETGQVIDLSSGTGQLVYAVETMRAVDELNTMTGRLQGSRRKKAEQGRNPGMSIPTGYYIDPELSKGEPQEGCFLIYEPHGRFVSFVFEQLLALGRSSPRQILKACQQYGFDVLPPFGPQPLRKYMESRSGLRACRRDAAGNYVVSATLVSSIIKNHEWYAGVFKWGMDRKWGDPIRIEGNHPAIIDPTWTPAIQRMLKSRPARAQASHEPLPLSGLVRTLNAAGEQVPLEHAATTGNGPRYVYAWEYRRSEPDSLTWSLSSHLIDRPVTSVVLSRLVLPDYAEQVAAQLNTRENEVAETMERHRAMKRSLEKAIENLESNFARVSNPEDVDSIVRQLAEHRAELAELTAQEKRLSVHENEQSSSHDIEIYRALMRDLPVLWQAADNTLRNRLLALILQRVELTRDRTHFDARIVWFDGQEDVIRVHIPVRFLTRKKWTDEEDEYLRVDYATADWETLTERLDRKEGAIANRAFNLGLKRQAPTGPKRRWSEVEIEVLQSYSRSEICYEEMREALPNRNEQAIYRKMSLIGLSQPTEPFWYYLTNNGSRCPSGDTRLEGTISRASEGMSVDVESGVSKLSLQA